MKKAETHQEETRLVEIEEQALDQVKGGYGEDEDEIEIDSNP